MGKRAYKKTARTPYGSHNSITLREEANGKRLNVNVKSKLKHQHLQNLAVWAVTVEASISSFAALLGQSLAAVGEALGIQPDPASLFTCQRCETVLQPGFNSTILIEKNQRMMRRRKTHNFSTKNNVVYTCDFFTFKNLRRRTPNGHMKEICPPRVRPSSKSQPANPMLKKCSLEKDTRSKDKVVKVDEMPRPLWVEILPSVKA